MATPRLGLVVEDKPTELSCSSRYWNFPDKQALSIEEVVQG